MKKLSQPIPIPSKSENKLYDIDLGPIIHISKEDHFTSPEEKVPEKLIFQYLSSDDEEEPSCWLKIKKDFFKANEQKK